MRLQDTIDFTTLTWVKSELDQTLKQAHAALEAYVEDPSDASQIRFCATYLHQVQGTLRMVELFGAATVSEEMEQLAIALLGDQVASREEAYAVLMRGIVQLPDYLERLQSGHKDIPVVLLPLVNELRAARGEKPLAESALFTPDLSRTLPATARGPETALPEAELRRQAESLRAQFQTALLHWFRNDDPDTHVSRLVEVCDNLIAVTHEEEARRLFWVAAGVLEALRAKAFEPSTQLKQTIGKVEREIKRLADAGEISFRVDPPRELTRALLYFVAHAPTEHGRIGELRQTFRLDLLLPTEAELEHARGSMSGHNRALLNTVSAAIKEDLLRVKDALDIHLRTRSTDVAALAQHEEVLTRVGDTLGMLGLGVPRRVVSEQRQILEDIVAGKRQGDEAALLDIAGALLYVEASLDDQVQHLGAAAQPDGEDEGVLPQVESRKVLDALVREAEANFAQAKQSFVAFVESGWDHAQLSDVPRLLDEVTGALRILELDDPPRYLSAVRQFTQAELLERHRVPNGPQMDTLADALASLEYYLEALREQRAGRERILDTTRISLERLGYWPIPEYRPFQASTSVAEALAAEAIAEVAPEPAVDPAIAFEAAETDAGTPPPVAADLAPAATETVPAVATVDESLGDFVPGFEDIGEDIDEEIREVFVEEVQEEIRNLGELLPIWRAAPTDLETIKPIRRVFHTLKGSGRLVGALTLGEFSWKVEGMLNRVLDATIEPWPEVLVVVGEAHDVLPQLLAALRGEPTRRVDIVGIKDAADRLAGGERLAYVRPQAEPTAAEIAETIETIETIGSTADQVAGAVESAAVELDEAVAAEFVEHFDAAVAEAEETPAAEEEPAALPEPPVEVPVESEAEVETDVFASADAAEEEAVIGQDEPSTGTPFVIDTVLFDILKTEVEGHLETLDDYIGQSQTGPRQVSDQVLRAVHTMSGAFAMTEVPHIGEVAGPLESYIKRLLAREEAPSASGLGLIAEATAAIRSLMAGLDSDAPLAPAFPRLAERMQAIRDTLPEPTGPLLPLHTEDAALAALEAERLEAERAEAERAEAERVEAERVEAERVEAERAEAERVEAERVEAERVEAERVEAERVEAERVEAERV
ncbi:MAG: Hpt domain-containing protein, partial [Lysobacteraceae bacterium]